MSFPYDLGGLDRQWMFEVRLAFAITDPRSMIRLSNVTEDAGRLIVKDPALRWARSWREFFGQLRDVMLHEFWVAQGRASRSPGAVWV